MILNRTYALGMIETIGLTCLIPALDDAVKAAEVKVIKYEKADAGIVTGYMIGDVSSVEAAIESGSIKAKQLGGFRSSKVIAKPNKSIFFLLDAISFIRNEKKEILEVMSLDELRKIVRGIRDFPFTGREIYKLKKADLIEIILDIHAGGDDR